MRKILFTAPLLLMLLIAVLPVLITGAEPPILAKKYERIVFVHYTKPSDPGKPQRPPVDNTAYKLIGPKWSALAISYVIDPDGAPNGAVDEIKLAFETWDKVTTAELFNDEVTVDPTAKPSLDAPDFRNVVCWRGIAPTSNVAMTVLWYEDKDGSGSPTVGDETIDTDIIFNALLKWGIDPDDEGPIKIKAYDVQNVATHEAGHVIGLGDLAGDIHRELTMYAYTAKGETIKISLQTGDVTGCQVLYGA